MRTAMLLAAVLAVGSPVSGLAQSATPYLVDLGRSLYDGQVATGSPARLRWEERALPVSAAHCANCHAAAKGAEPFGPRLTADSLLTLAPRRGGPPSAYDRDSFCRVVSQGVDNTGVMLSKAMPQYPLSEPECSAIWSFLLTQ
jgi:mono/diheme cytochrome c family protein